MDRVNILPNERVGIPDYEAGAGGQLVQEDQVREGRVFILPSGRSTGVASTPGRVFGGFGFSTNPVGSATATLLRGTGIFPMLDDDNQFMFGLLMGDEGPSQSILDFSAASNNTYAVYVRPVNTNGSFENRVFWNPGTPVEFVDNVATRKVASWETTFQAATAAPPGNGEWVKIWEITVVANLITVISDYRHFYFEGDAQASPIYDAEWGDGANDRNGNRADYGIQDLHMWIQAVRRQLRDIIDQSSWYAVPAIPLSLLDNEHQNVGAPTPGAHSDVTSFSLRATPDSASKEALVLRATNKVIADSSDPQLGRISDPQGGTPLRLEPYGRIAYPHRFFDDFHYSTWLAYTSTPAIYNAYQIGGGDVVCGASNNTEPQVSQLGAALVFKTTAAGVDTAEIRGPRSWVLDSSKSRYRFFARYAMDSAAPTTRVDQFGLLAEVGTPWTLAFIRDQGTYGDGNWRFVVTDLIDTKAQALGATFPVADTYQNFYFAVSGHQSVEVFVSGMPAAITIDLSTALPSPITLNGAGVTQRPYCRMGNNGVATAIQGYLDYWEITDNVALSRADGNQF